MSQRGEGVITRVAYVELCITDAYDECLRDGEARDGTVALCDAEIVELARSVAATHERVVAHVAGGVARDFWRDTAYADDLVAVPAPCLDLVPGVLYWRVAAGEGESVTVHLRFRRSAHRAPRSHSR